MDAKENEKMESDMARMLAMLDRIASEHGDTIPELNDMVKTEIAAQSRANPNVVAKVAQRVADDGRDPVQMLSRSLPAADVQDMQRRGRINVVAPAVAMMPGTGPEGAASAGPRLVLRLPPGASAAAAASGDAPADAPAASASAEAAAPAASASVALPLHLPAGGMLPRGRAGGDKAAAGDDKPAAGADKPAACAGKPAPHAPRIGGGR